MTILKFISGFLLIAFYSCGQNTAKKKIDPEATALSNKIIPLVSYLENPDSCKKALLYLDSATNIDNNCFTCHHNKLMFLSSLKQFKRAVETVNECLRLMPTAYDLYLTGGILYEKIGDTISSKKYFEKSLNILNPVLDTMTTQNIEYQVFSMYKAINLIMIGENKSGNDLLKLLIEREQEPELKQNMLTFMNKTKKQLVEMFTEAQYSR
ncbi:MAG: hypothetical protein IPG86_02910 [Chitinophagaceae bacterium]|nr:hypothetical protein [Chitinophagaceae bacterium]